jgi:hypothetical protein
MLLRPSCLARLGSRRPLGLALVIDGQNSPHVFFDDVVVSADRGRESVLRHAIAMGPLFIVEPIVSAAATASRLDYVDALSAACTPQGLWVTFRSNNGDRYLLTNQGRGWAIVANATPFTGQAVSLLGHRDGRLYAVGGAGTFSSSNDFNLALARNVATPSGPLEYVNLRPRGVYRLVRVGPLLSDADGGFHTTFQENSGESLYATW